jgi:hypothetical protein
MVELSWRKNFNPEVVAKALEKTVNRSVPSKITLNGPEVKDYMVLLKSMVDFPEQICEHEKSSLIWSAIMRTVEIGPITSASLLKELRRATLSSLRTPLMPYLLASTISLRPIDFERKLSICGAKVNISSRLKKSALIARAELFEDAEHCLNAPHPERYSYVTATVQARSMDDAFEKGMTAVNLVRAIWNFYKNRQTYRIITHPSKWCAVNKVVLGPFHTMHLRDGSLAKKRWFYDPNFRGEITAAVLADFKNHRKFEENIRRKLNKSLYRPFLENALIRYSAALDNADWNTCFLELWGLLELLTDTKNANYSQTIERASSIYASNDIEVQILQHLRIARNNYVHQSEASSDILTLIYQLKQTVEYLLEFHLNCDRHFADQAEAMRFLELPRDRKSITRQIELLKMADVYRSNE